ncbi:hypothetical protein QCE63_35520, partial [Caballeronia sp. LZ065]|uniref:hypothetical protein n=1 Tax=Caballeronia sp. LZ065 TaxID=3038571 RepID=UPI002856C5FE
NQVSGTALASALIGHTGLGSRTHWDKLPFNELAQHLKGPAQRYALPKGTQGKPVGDKSNDVQALAASRALADPIDRTAARSAAPEL